MARLAVLAAIAAGVLLALVPAGAGAHRLSIKTTAVIESGGPEGAEGRVGSPRAKCRRNRLVELFRVDELGGPDQSFGTDRTDGNGDWSVEAPLIAGDYFVKVKRKRLRRPAQHGRHGCKRARSKTKRL